MSVTRVDSVLKHGRSRASGAAQGGLTIIEVVVFIVVIGILAVALMSAIINPLTGAGTQQDAVFVTQLAQERLDVVLAQKRREGFPGSDPCDAGATLATCDEPAGYTITTSFDAWSENPDTDHYQVITVSVSSGGSGAYSTSTLVTKLEDG
jgi:type II secretory pathway pseudopilin PulG